MNFSWRSFVLAGVVLGGVMFSVSGALAAVTCPAPATDWTIVGGVCIPKTTGLSATSVSDILVNFMNWLLGIFGFLSVIAFVVSGIQYLTAAGDDDQITTAKRNTKYSIIGIVIALSGFVVFTAIMTAFKGASNTF